MADASEPAFRDGKPARPVRARARGHPLRARPIGHRRHHRRDRAHQVRQRQVLRDLEVFARRAARPGPSHPQLAAPSQGVHPRPVADHRAGPRLARRTAQPGEGRLALLGRYDHRAVPRRARQAVAVHGDPLRHHAAEGSRRSACASSPRWPAWARCRRSSRTRCAIRWPASAARSRSSPRDFPPAPPKSGSWATSSRASIR